MQKEDFTTSLATSDLASHLHLPCLHGPREHPKVESLSTDALNVAVKCLRETETAHLRKASLKETSASMQGNLTSLHAQVCKVAPDALSVHAKRRRRRRSWSAQKEDDGQAKNQNDACSAKANEVHHLSDDHHQEQLQGLPNSTSCKTEEKSEVIFHQDLERAERRLEKFVEHLEGKDASGISCGSETFRTLWDNIDEWRRCGIFEYLPLEKIEALMQALDAKAKDETHVEQEELEGNEGFLAAGGMLTVLSVKGLPANACTEERVQSSAQLVTDVFSKWVNKSRSFRQMHLLGKALDSIAAVVQIGRLPQNNITELIPICANALVRSNADEAFDVRTMRVLESIFGQNSEEHCDHIIQTLIDCSQKQLQVHKSSMSFFVPCGSQTQVQKQNAAFVRCLQAVSARALESPERDGFRWAFHWAENFMKEILRRDTSKKKGYGLMSFAIEDFVRLCSLPDWPACSVILSLAVKIGIDNGVAMTSELQSIASAVFNLQYGIASSANNNRSPTSDNKMHNGLQGELERIENNLAQEFGVELQSRAPNDSLSELAAIDLAIEYCLANGNENAAKYYVSECSRRRSERENFSEWCSKRQQSVRQHLVSGAGSMNGKSVDASHVVSQVVSKSSQLLFATGQKAFHALIQMANHKQPKTRASALRALAPVARSQANLSSDVWKMAHNRTEDVQADVRLAALQLTSSAFRGYPIELAKVAANRANDVSPAVRQEAIRALEKCHQHLEQENRAENLGVIAHLACDDNQGVRKESAMAFRRLVLDRTRNEDMHEIAKLFANANWQKFAEENWMLPIGADFPFTALLRECFSHGGENFKRSLKALMAASLQRVSLPDANEGHPEAEDLLILHVIGSSVSLQPQAAFALGCEQEIGSALVAFPSILTASIEKCSEGGSFSVRTLQCCLAAVRDIVSIYTPASSETLTKALDRTVVRAPDPTSISLAASSIGVLANRCEGPNRRSPLETIWSLACKAFQHLQPGRSSADTVRRMAIVAGQLLRTSECLLANLSERAKGEAKFDTSSLRWRLAIAAQEKSIGEAVQAECMKALWECGPGNYGREASEKALSGQLGEMPRMVCLKGMADCYLAGRAEEYDFSLAPHVAQLAKSLAETRTRFEAARVLNALSCMDVCDPPTLVDPLCHMALDIEKAPRSIALAALTSLVNARADTVLPMLKASLMPALSSLLGKMRAAQVTDWSPVDTFVPGIFQAVNSREARKQLIATLLDGVTDGEDAGGAAIVCRALYVAQLDVGELSQALEWLKSLYCRLYPGEEPETEGASSEIVMSTVVQLQRCDLLRKVITPFSKALERHSNALSTAQVSALPSLPEMHLPQPPSALAPEDARNLRAQLSDPFEDLLQSFSSSNHNWKNNAEDEKDGNPSVNASPRTSRRSSITTTATTSPSPTGKRRPSETPRSSTKRRRRTECVEGS